ncbi:MAG: hypothetical protein ABFS38_18885, partial [Bacteroidota bacterium]
TESNARVLSLEINYNGDRWAGLGFDSASETVSYLINEGFIYIYYPDSALLKNKAFRVLLMRID